MKCIRIDDLKKDENLKDIIYLYRHAFPLVERLPFFRFYKLVKNGTITFTKYLEDNNFLGFTIVYNNPNNRHFFFFAVKPEYRNRGFGKEIVHHVLNDGDLPVYLSAEYYPEGTPDTDIRVRRVNFYLRNGLVLLPVRIQELTTKFYVLGSNKDVDCSKHFDMFKKILGFVFYLLYFFYRIEKVEEPKKSNK